MSVELLKLRCGVQHYHWGLPGRAGVVGKLGGFEDSDKPCAELWIGAHPSLPAFVEHGGRLDQLISANAEEHLGADVIKRFGPKLPFLLKVLSIAEPLSIQAHPDKQTAERLRKTEQYPDANHKPEVALALVRSSLLYGFRPIKEVALLMERLPVLEKVFGCSCSELLRSSDKPDAAVREMVAALNNHSAKDLKDFGSELLKAFSKQDELRPEDQWTERMLASYPDGDVGIFCFYIMNLVSLAPGRAIFIAPNVLHAYLEGELLECMTNSDTVVRAGLTPKPRDVKTLLQMLDYHPSAAPLIDGRRLPSGEVEYGPGIELAAEFAISEVCSESEIVAVTGTAAPEIIFCLSGSAVLRAEESQCAIAAGEACFVPAITKNYVVHAQHARVFRVRVPTE